MAVIGKAKAKKTADKPEAKQKAVIVSNIALKPRVSEKSYALSEKLNTYIFDVPHTSNKFDIAHAVKSQFNVIVTGVRVASVPGKAVRSYKNGGRKSINAKRSDLRKAYVTLKEGDKLPIFAAAEEPTAPKESK